MTDDDGREGQQRVPLLLSLNLDEATELIADGQRERERERGEIA